jgi:hypothetical protein
MFSIFEIRFIEKMPHIESPTPKLNSLQLSLLRLFTHISEAQTLEVRKILLEYFDGKLKAELDTVVKEKGYQEEDFRQMLGEKS